MQVFDNFFLEKYGASTEELFSQADANGDGYVDGSETLAFFPKFKLPREQLKQVWDECVSEQAKGFSKDDFFKALNMIASFSLLTITQTEKDFYKKHFKSISPEAKDIEGATARDFFMKSGLPVDDLKKIWVLSDLNRDGLLNVDEFAIAMHLIRLKTKYSDFIIPQVLPASMTPQSSLNEPVNEPIAESIPQKPSTPIAAKTEINITLPSRPEGGEVATLKYFLQAAKDEISALQNSINAAQNSLNNLRKQELSYTQEKDRMQADLKQYYAKKDTLYQSIASINAQIEVRAYEKAIFTADINMTKQVVSQVQAEMSTPKNTLKNDLNELSAQITQIQTQCSTSKNENAQLLARKDEAAFKLNALKNENESKKQELSQKVAAERIKVGKCLDVYKNIEAALNEYKNTLKQDAKLFVDTSKVMEPPKATTPKVNTPVTSPSKVQPPVSPSPVSPVIPKVVPAPAPKFDDFETSFDDGFGNDFGSEEWDAPASKPAPINTILPEPPKPVSVGTPTSQLPVKPSMLPEPPKLLPDSPKPAVSFPEPPKMANKQDESFDEFDTFHNTAPSSDWDAFNNNNSSVTTSLDEWGMEFGDVKSPQPPKQAPVPTSNMNPPSNLSFDDSFDASFDDNF